MKRGEVNPNSNEQPHAIQNHIVTARTDGSGFWSSVKKTVLITDLFLTCHHGDEMPEVFLTFDTDTWNTATDGLIYSDKGFMNTLRIALIAAGYPEDAVDELEYSEQGMQGKDFVHCMAGWKFAKAVIAQPNSVMVEAA